MPNELRCTRRVKVKGKSKTCGELANEYEVVGPSFTARATLCVKRMLMASNEGFTLKAVEEPK
jgi:hypothetical protein